MSTSILVTYASSYGSTQEVAEFIAAALREQGAEVELRPSREVRTLTGYRAVVLGAPLYMFHWHKDARRFLTRYQNVLTGGLPLAIFAGGPIGESDEKAWQEIRDNLNRELAKFPWLTPVSVQLIGGKFDPAKLRLPYSLLPALRKMPASDLRDWPAIRAWANSLIEKFQLLDHIPSGKGF
jgi:menaquinone-dependent protoporphyrinogen oxidase